MPYDGLSFDGFRICEPRFVTFTDEYETKHENDVTKDLHLFHIIPTDKEFYLSYKKFTRGKEYFLSNKVSTKVGGDRYLSESEFKDKCEGKDEEAVYRHLLCNKLPGIISGGFEEADEDGLLLAFDDTHPYNILPEMEKVEAETYVFTMFGHEMYHYALLEKCEKVKTILEKMLFLYAAKDLPYPHIIEDRADDDLRTATAMLWYNGHKQIVKFRVKMRLKED